MLGSVATKPAVAQPASTISGAVQRNSGPMWAEPVRNTSKRYDNLPGRYTLPQSRHGFWNLMQ